LLKQEFQYDLENDHFMLIEEDEQDRGVDGIVKKV
jgi:hypothetical protein